MDVFGKALSDFFTGAARDILWVHNSYDEPEEMPVEIYFRSADELPELERLALSLCKGRVLDVGAGVGSHALFLQDQGLDVTAIDISPAAADIMRARGLKNVMTGDILSFHPGSYDTLLFMMNGIGLTGSLKGLRTFLSRVKTMLEPGGQLLFDSSDLMYLYQDVPFPTKGYYGEVSFRFEYQHVKGDWFKWIYIDQQRLKTLAAEMGWHTEILFEDGQDQYLARLTLTP